MDIEEYIFHEYKDKVIQSQRFRSEIARKYKLTAKEISNLFVRVNNYQVNKYGCRINNKVDLHTREDCRKVAHTRAVSNYKRRVYENKRDV